MLIERESTLGKWGSASALIADLAGVGVSLVTLAARPADRSGVIEARQIVLRDKYGRMRAALAVQPDGSGKGVDPHP
jgi:hypothetical protein